MKTRALTLITGLLFTVFSIQAQIANEIKSYIDSTEIVLNNGRRLMYHSLATADYEKANEVYVYLKAEAAKKHCFAFNYNEELYINLLLLNWTGWFDNAARYKEQVRLTSCYSYNENYVERLYNLVTKNFDRIEDDLSEKTIGVDERDLIRLYLYLIKTDKPDEIYNARHKSFTKKYTSSIYSDFVKDYLPRPAVRGAFAMSLGPTLIKPVGNLGEVFKQGMLLNYTLDFNIGKIYSGLHFEAGGLDLKVPINFSDLNGNVVERFVPGDMFFFAGGGIYAGYFAIRSKNFQLAPFVNIGGYTFESNLYSDYDEQEYQIFDSFVFGPGIHTELKLTEFSIDPYYGSIPGMETTSYISLKMDIGYDIVTKKVSPDFKGNLPYIRFGLVWGIGNF